MSNNTNGVLLKRLSSSPKFVKGVYVDVSYTEFRMMDLFLRGRSTEE